MFYYLWKRLTRELVLLATFWMPPERRRGHRAPAARPRGAAQAQACRLCRGLLRQERPHLAARAAVALLPAPLRARPLGSDRLRQSAAARTPASRGSSSPTTTTCATIPATSTTAATSTTSGRSCWCAIRPTSRSRSIFQWKFRMRPHKKGAEQVSGARRRGRRLRVRDGRGGRACQGHRLHERLGDASCRSIKEMLVRALRGPARRHRRRARPGAALHGPGADGGRARRLRRLRQRREHARARGEAACSGSPAAACGPRTRPTPNSFKVRRAKVGGYRDYFDDAQVAADRRAWSRSASCRASATSPASSSRRPAAIDA